MSARTGKWVAPAVAGRLILLLAPFPAGAGDTVREIMVMLEGGLSEELILEWLDAGGGTLDRPGANDLLELKEAGASEGFLRELLRRVASVSSPPPVEPRAGSEPSAGQPATAPSIAPGTGPDATVLGDRGRTAARRGARGAGRVRVPPGAAIADARR